ncbi:MAG TPA: universal stress protein [Burkholderiales bacterium]|nr:universal stress protein [Burkholderiales bacterium]
MMKILIPVDGSDNANRAVQYLIKLAGISKQPLEVHLLNIQHPMPGTVGESAQAKQYHHDAGVLALAAARKLLDDAKVSYTYHISVGDVGDIVAHFVNELKCDQVVMGTRGAGAVANMVMGSAATKVLNLVKVPVLLVK